MNTMEQTISVGFHFNDDFVLDKKKKCQFVFFETKLFDASRKQKFIRAEVCRKPIL
jgi:hypothetical protein